MMILYRNNRSLLEILISLEDRFGQRDHGHCIRMVSGSSLGDTVCDAEPNSTEQDHPTPQQILRLAT